MMVRTAPISRPVGKNLQKPHVIFQFCVLTGELAGENTSHPDIRDALCPNYLIENGVNAKTVKTALFCLFVEASQVLELKVMPCAENVTQTQNFNNTWPFFNISPAGQNVTLFIGV